MRNLTLLTKFNIMKTFTQLVLAGIFFLLLSTAIHAQEMWGMTEKGGEYDMGVIFKTDADGSNYTVVKSLSKGYPGNYPGRIVPDGNGVLYGLTKYGGKFNQGVIFKYNYITLEYEVLYNFGENDEENPLEWVCQNPVCKGWWCEYCEKWHPYGTRCSVAAVRNIRSGTNYPEIDPNWKHYEGYDKGEERRFLDESLWFLVE